MPSANNLLLMPYLSHDANKQLTDLDKDRQLGELLGDSGHLNGILGISQKAQQIKDFIEH
ncbi:MAG: homoserine O-acetyltransferase [Paraglaciecola sp.]